MFEAEAEYVRRSLRRLGVRPADLDDLSQDVFVAVHGAFATYDAARAIRPWLFAFVFRVASNYRRLARHRAERFPEELPDGVDEKTPEAEVVARRRRDLLLEALGELPIDRRSAVVMFDMDGFTAGETAEVLGVPINTVYSRVRKGRDELRRSLKRLEGLGGRE